MTAFAKTSGGLRLGLSGRQRTAFLARAAACAIAGLMAVPLSRPWTEQWPRPADLWFIGFAPLLWAIALYYLRVAHGWVVVDDAGLRTSRLIRGRSIRWTDVQQITTRTYVGRGGSVTVVKVHPRRGLAFLLPAPRTTIVGDRDFEAGVRQLRAHAHKTST